MSGSETPDAGAGADGEPEVVIGEMEMTRALTVQMTAVGTLGLAVAVWGFSLLYATVTGAPPTYRFGAAGAGWWTDAANLLVLVVLSVAFIPPHEWLHGLAIRHYGGEPRYGVGVAHFVLPYAYATTDHKFTRNQFVVVLLTPLVVVTAVCTPLMLALGWGWLVLPLATNAAGAVADVWMTMTLLSYPSYVRLADSEAGTLILGRERDRPRSPSVTALVWDALSGAAVASVGVLVLLAAGGPLLLPALGVDSLTLGTPDTITFLFAFSETPDEVSLSVGPGVLVVGAVVGLAYAFARSYARSRGGPRDVAE